MWCELMGVSEGNDKGWDGGCQGFTRVQLACITRCLLSKSGGEY